LSAGAPLGELTALSQTPSWILAGLLLRERERDERGKGKREKRVGERMGG